MAAESFPTHDAPPAGMRHRSAPGPVRPGESIPRLTGLHEALRDCGEANPSGRAVLLATLASLYRHLDHDRRGVEYLREMTRLQDSSGRFAAWGYRRLAEAYLDLGELDMAAEAIDHAERLAPERTVGADPHCSALRARLSLALGRFDAAVRHGRDALAAIEERVDPALRHAVYLTLAEAESRRGDDRAAAGHYRYCNEIAATSFPQRLPDTMVALAETLFRLGDHDEASSLLAEATATMTMISAARARAIRLRAAMAERAGDLRAVIDLERRAFALECAIRSRELKRALDNIETVGRADSLMHEAAIERERASYRSFELAAANAPSAALHAADAVERRLHDALRMTPPGEEGRARDTLSEALAMLRGG